MNIKLIRNLITGLHRGQTRIWLEPTVLEAAGFSVGDGVRQVIQDDAVILTRSDDTTRIVSKRKRASWSAARPIFDSCSRDVSLILQSRQRIDVLVSEGIIIIRKVTSFDLTVIRQPMLQGAELKKLRLYSAPCGGGMATAALEATGYFEPVGALDVWATAVDAYRHNFDDGCVYLGDLIRKHPDYVPAADACWLSPSCTLYSGLGTQTGGIGEGHAAHYARLVMASGASVVMIEQVPAYFKSDSYRQLKQLLQLQLPVCHETVIDAYAMGSVASRTRGYAVFLQSGMRFRWPTLPKLPEHRRQTIGQVIGKEWEEGRWRPIEGTVMEGLLNKSGNNNFKAEKNHTLVELTSQRVSAFPFSYSKVQVTSSYLKHPDKEQWRLFRSDEMLRLMNIPEDYRFPDYMSEADRVKLIGQSVDGQVVRAIGTEVVMSIMARNIQAGTVTGSNTPLMPDLDTLLDQLDDEGGQYCFPF